MRRLLQLTLFCLLAITTVIQTFAADPLTVSMGKASWPGETTYSATITSNDKKWTFSNFGNNDNSWDYVRIGKKESTTTSTLTSIEPIAEKIESASFNIKAWLRGEITAIKVQVCPDSKFAESNTTTDSLSTMPTQEGEITIPIEKPVANQYYKINITCKNSSTSKNGVIDIDWFKFYPVESSDTRQDVTLAWSESAVSTNIGETFTAPTLTVDPAAAKPSVVYSSSVSSVAEIANDGTVTIKAVGQTTITAAIPDEDATYKPKSASYTLTVIDPNEVYYLVKTKDDFDVTQECILVAYKAKSYQAAMGAQGSGNYRSAVSYSSIDASLPEVLLAPAGTVPFTLEPVADSSTYYIKVGENTYLSISNSGSNTNEETQTLSATAIDLSFNDNRATLKYSGVDGTRALGYNNSTNPKRFASYTATDATYNKVYLYQKRSATPALGDIKFSPASGSTVDEGTEITISAQNATSLAYSIKTGDVWSESVMITGNSVNVPVSEDCTISVIAKNDETHEQKSAEATYTVAHPVTYELVEEYNGNDIPDGDYIFASTTANGSFMMKGQNGDYRSADKVTITDNKFDAYSRFEITVQKEDNGYYSLLTKEGKYIYATAEKKVAESDDATSGQGKWQPIITGSTMTFNWVNGKENFGSLQMNKNANDERFTTYTSSQAPISLYVITHDLPKISYHFVDGKDEAAFYAENGTITEIRPYLIDGTLEAEALDLNTYTDNAIPFRFSQPRFKVTASNKYGDTVEDFSFIQELCDRRGITNGGYTVNIEYVDFNDQQKVASFPLANEEGSLLWEMSGYLVNESDDILDTYPFLIKETYIRLAMSYLNADGPTILNVKIAAPADGGEGVYGAPAHAPATDDLVATKGNFNFVQNGGSHFYFDGQGKNFIKGNIEVSPFEYANISITSIDDVTTEVSDILDEDAEEVFYNLQGVRVENPDKGIYIRVKGNKTEKILK